MNGNKIIDNYKNIKINIMENPIVEEDSSWKPTKREFEIDNNNIARLTKVTYEHKSSSYNTKTDTHDTIIKSTGIVAIFIPLLLLYFNNRTDSNNQRQRQKALLFGQITKSYYAIFNYQNSNFYNLSSIDSIHYLLATQVELANTENTLFNDVEKLDSNILLYAKFNKTILFMDSLDEISGKAFQFVKDVKTSNTNKKLYTYPNFNAYATFISLYNNLGNFFLETKNKNKEENININPDTIKTQIEYLLKNSWSYFLSVYTNITQNASLKNGNSNATKIAIPNNLDSLASLFYAKDSVFINSSDTIKSLLPKYLNQFENQFAQIRKEMIAEVNK